MSLPLLQSDGSMPSQETDNLSQNVLNSGNSFPNSGMLSMIPNLKGSNANDFFQCLEKVGKLAGWNKEHLLTISEVKIEGPAKKYYDSSIKQNSELTYDTFKNFIVSHFADDQSFAIDFAKFSSAQQYEHESVRDFSVRLQSLVNKSFCDDTEENEVLSKFRTKILLSKFMSGLKPSLKAPLVVQNPTQFKEAVEVAIRVEKSLNLQNPNVNALASNPQDTEVEKLKQQQNDCMSKMSLMIEQMAILSDQISKLQNKSANTNSRPYVNSPVRRQVTCFYCNIKGHIEPDCRKKLRDQRRERQFANANRGSNSQRQNQSENLNG
ncbi:hypothetical protein AVEN_176571-1 [Araneus ventricosus]|uniref:Retrotransposon gag domain-containing protein n=1 Tax=Araneus ventricosus TaxID=182803 RepID=A0A4Y2VN77_ARAVE|nr:hypothetical protein AVEN_176571-1 [Araneus ventricosus]